MQEIFKYFVGIIGVLILVYVLIVVLRTVLTSGVSTGANIISDPVAQQNIASGTKDIVNAVGQFSLANWLRDFRPFSYAPMEVTTDVTDRATPKYYNDDLSKYNTSAWKENLNWQNLRDAPDRHPTDFAPIGNYYYNQLNGGNSSEEEDVKQEIEVSDKYIKPNTKPRSIVKNNSVISGLAYYKVFTMGKFPIYILNEEGDTVGEIIAYANGDVQKDGGAPFRAVVNLKGVFTSRGFLMFKNENTEISGIKAVNTVPVYFQP
jgi:hypothetical protein